METWMGKNVREMTKEEYQEMVRLILLGNIPRTL
jgi:hypothetical protein